MLPSQFRRLLDLLRNSSEALRTDLGALKEVIENQIRAIRDQTEREGEQSKRAAEIVSRAIGSTDDDKSDDRTYREKNYRVQKILAFVTFLAFLAAAVAAGGAIYYARIANRTLKEIKSQTCAAWELQQNANDFFRTDERAWLEIVPEIFPSKPLLLESNTPPFYDYRFAIKNTGKTPAKIMKVGDNTRGIINGKDSEIGLRDYPLIPRPAPVLLVPGSDIPWILRGIMQTNSVMPDGRLMLHQYIGRIDYQDIFGGPHWVTFCYQLHDDATPAMCEFGNSGDTEKPKDREPCPSNQ